jgi:hypothetical protein
MEIHAYASGEKCATVLLTEILVGNAIPNHYTIFEKEKKNQYVIDDRVDQNMRPR